MENAIVFASGQQGAKHGVSEYNNKRPNLNMESSYKDFRP
jgi:hypothetical protein